MTQGRFTASLAVALSVLLLAPAAPADERVSEVSYFFFGVRMRSRSSGTGDSREGSSRRKPSDKELASAPHTCPSCERDEHGRMKVLTESRSDFLRESGYPYGRKGYVIDYVVPLPCGGADAPANMRWRPVAEAKPEDARCAE